MKKSNELYISDTTEDPKYGDAQVLVAGEKEKCECTTKEEACGNQEKDYYDCCEEKKELKEKVGNQSKEYYNE